MYLPRINYYVVRTNVLRKRTKVVYDSFSAGYFRFRWPKNVIEISSRLNIILPRRHNTSIPRWLCSTKGTKKKMPFEWQFLLEKNVRTWSEGYSVYFYNREEISVIFSPQHIFEVLSSFFVGDLLKYGTALHLFCTNFGFTNFHRHHRSLYHLKSICLVYLFFFFLPMTTMYFFQRSFILNKTLL